MKISIAVSTPDAEFSALALKGRFRENFELVSSLGFDGVEISVRDPAALNTDELQSLTEEFSLSIAAMGTGRAFGEDGLSFSDSDPDIRKRAVERIGSHIELASALECRVILGLILGKNPPAPETERRILDCLRPCAELAADKNVVLVIEPINRYETGFINRVDDCLALLDKLDRPACRVLLDTFHMNIEEPSIHESIRKAGGRIGHVHAADSNRWYPGAGHLDFPEILRTLKEAGYSGFLSAEILPLPDPKTAATRTAENLRAFLQGI